MISGKAVANFSLGGVSNQKEFKKVVMRIGDRYHVYRKNGYSRIYFIESVLIEIVKMILS